jgi:hypothetical protein
MALRLIQHGQYLEWDVTQLCSEGCLPAPVQPFSIAQCSNVSKILSARAQRPQLHPSMRLHTLQVHPVSQAWCNCCSDSQAYSLHGAVLHLVSSSPGLIAAHHAPSIPSRVPYSSTNAQPLYSLTQPVLMRDMLLQQHTPAVLRYIPHSGSTDQLAVCPHGRVARAGSKHLW